MLMNFNENPVVVARRLVGCTLLVDGVGGVIVETEAYDADDPASQGYKRRTNRSSSMFGPPGHAYVYLIYGLHWCLNIVCREAGHGAAVLIRALQPTHGLDVMGARRQVSDPRALASGPGRVGQALGIDKSFDGLALDRPPFELLAPSCPVDIVCGMRVGIGRAAHLPRRFGLTGSPYLSRRID